MTRDRYNKKEYGDTGGTPNNVYLTVASDQVQNTNLERSCQKIISWIQKYIKYYQDCCSITQVKTLADLKGLFESVVNENSSGMFKTTIDYASLETETQQILKVLKHQIESFVQLLNEEFNHVNQGNAAESLIFSIICYHHLTGKLMKCIPRNYSSITTTSNTKEIKELEGYLVEWLLLLDIEVIYNSDQKKLYYFTHRDNGLDEEVRRLFKVKKISDRRGLVLFLKANALVGKSNDVAEVLRNIENDQTLLKLLFLFNLAWKYDSFYSSNTTNNYSSFNYNLPYSFSAKALTTALSEVDIRCLKHIYKKDKNPCPMVNIISRIDYELAVGETIVELLRNINKQSEEINADKYTTTTCLQTLLSNVFKYAVSGENINTLHTLMQNQDFVYFFRSKLLETKEFSGPFVNNVLLQDYCDEKLALHLINSSNGNGVSLKNLVKLCSDKDSIQVLVIDKIKDLVSNNNNYYNYYYSRDPIVINIIKEIIANSAHNIILTPISKEKLERWISGLNNINNIGNSLEFFEKCQITFIPNTNSLLDVALRSIIKRIIKIKTIKDMNFWIKTGIESYSFNYLYLYDLFFIIAEEFLNDFDVYSSKEVLAFEFLFKSNQQMATKFNNEIFLRIKQRFIQEIEKLNRNEFTSKELQSNILKEENVNYFELINYISENRIGRKDYENCLETFLQSKGILNELKKTYQLLSALECDVSKTINLFVQLEAQMDDAPLYKIDQFILKNKKEIETIQKEILSKVSCNDNLDLFETISQSQIFFFYYSRGNQQDKIKIQKISAYISTCIEEIKNTIKNILLGKGDIDKILKGINFYNMHLPSEKKFLSLIGFDQRSMQSLLDAFELYQLKQHLVDFSELVRIYELPFYGEHYDILISDSRTAFNDSSTKLQELKQFIGEIDESTLRVFKHYIEYKTLVEYLNQHNFTENELRIINNKVAGNSFDEEIIQHLLSAKKLIDPLLDAMHGKFNEMLEFFDVLKDLQINQKQLDAMKECANNLEKVNNVVQSANQTSENLQYTVTQILKQGILFFDLEKIQYHVKVNDQLISEKEFKNLILTSTFQKLLSKELELFSTSGMFLESILKIISQLRNISHVCFQHRTLEFPLIILNDIPTMESILQVLKGISKEWHRKINQNNITYFNMKQRLIILRYLKEDTNISFNSIKHIVQSYFNISETNLHKCLQEIQNYLSNNSLLLDSSQFDWTNFTDVGPKLEQMENVILGALKEFILKITEVATSTPIPALSDIDGIDPCSVVSFIDLSNLFSLEQYYYLIYLQESVFLKSSNILFCKSDLTIIDIDVFLETALGGLNGRFVIYQIERLNGITRSYLLSKLLKFKSSIKNIQRQERQIVCVITNIESIGSSLPVQTKAISAVPTGNLEKIITKSFKFNKLFTLTSDVSGDGKTTTARTYLQEKKKKGYSISEIYYNNSSNASQLFKILFGAFGDEKGVIFLNISEDVDLKELNLFLLQLLLMGVFIDFSNGETVCVPNTKQWEMIIEVPSPTYLKDILLLSNNIATAMSVQKDFIVDDEARLFAEFFHYFKTGSLNKVSRNGEEIQIVKSFSLNDSQVRKYILDAYAENISRNDSQKSLFYLHTFTKFMAKRCHYLNDSTFSKFNIINNQIPTYFEHMLNEASDFMRHLFEHYEEFDYFSIYNSTEGNPIILPLKRSAQKPQFLKNLEEEYKRHGHQTELIESIENLKYVEKLVSYIALALEIKEKIVVDILYRHSYILTPHFAVQFLKIIEKISIGYPITLEGETGTGKTKLLEVISDLLAYQGTGRGNTNDQFPNLEKILISNDTIRTYDRQYNNNQLNNIYNDTEPWTTTIEGVELLLLNQSIPTEIKDSVFDVINDFVMDINNQPFVCSLSTGNKNITIIDELSKYKLAVQSFNELEQRSNALLKCLSALFKSNNYFSNTMLSAIKIEIETKIRPFLPNAIIVVENNRYNLLGYLDTVLSRQPIHEAIKQYSIKCYEVSGFVDSMKKFVADMLDNHPILKPSQELLDLLERQNINHEEVSQLLLEFIKTPLHSFFKAILMNNAVSEDDIYLKLKKKIDLARKCEEKKERIKFVFFIDEMNTSSHMGLMKQLIYDKYWQKVDGYLPSNILFVSAINPKKDDLYQVNILPKTMELYKSKWPDTDEGMEKDYILALVRSNTNIFRNSLKESQKQFLVELIMETHKATKLILKEERKKKTTKSFLSQRDIQRVFKVFNFFFEKFFGEFTDFGVDMKLSKVFTKTTLSMMAAVGVCYYLRMNKENRQVLDKKVSNLIQKQVGELPSQCKTLSNLMKLAVNTTSKHLEIPTSICKNEALTENMFSLIVGIESMVPVLLLGPPGCSKTLSLQLIVNNMRGNLSKNMFLKQFHALDLFRYQGSKHSSSEEIRKVCEQAKARQHNYDIKKEKSYALFFFDEAGVPKEEKESLKELHYYLNNPVFPSLLISNDTLDAAKSNRCVEILRSSVESQDLFKLAISILKRNETDRIDDSLETKHQIEHFCSVFSNFFKDSTFFGLRDFYHFLRYIRRNVNSDQLGRIQITPDLVVKAVERNLNGLSSSKIYNIAKEMLQCFSSDRKTIETLLLRMKDKFYNNTSILQDSINDKFRTNRENKDSLDNNVRYIMIIDETGDQSAYRLLLDTKIFDTNLSLNYSLSELEEDKNDIYQTNVISTICAAMESGKFAYLTNTRAIDGSFYDLFNQFNFKVKNDYYTTISIGAKSEYKKVHENFQCIVHLEKNELRDTPQALLNRFEKFNISIKDVLNYKLSKIQKNQVELLEKIREKLMDLVSFIGLNNFYSKNIEETIDSLLLSCIVNKQSNNGYTIVALPALFLQSSDLDSNSLKYILQTLVCRLLQLVRPEAIIIKLQDQTNYFSYYIRHYFENLSPMDLNNYVKKLADQSYVQSNKQIIHLPFDPYMSNNELFKSNDDSIRCFKVDHFGTEYQLQEKIKNFIEGSSKLLLFSLLYNSNSKLIDQLRRMIDNTTIPKDKVILLLIHSKSSQFASPSTKFSIFMNDWDILYIDNSSNLAKFDLSSYIQSIFFSPSINLAEQNELTKQTIINNMERILKQIPIETQKSSASNGFYTTNSISSRATMLLHILTNTHSFLLDGFIKTFNTKLNEEKKKEIIIYQAKQIITGNTIASLSQNLKSTIEKCIDFTFSNFLRLIISDMGVVKLQQSSSMNDTFELFVNTFLEIFDYGVSIDEILVKENSNTTIIPTRKTCSKLIFSDKLISSIDATIQQQINNTSHEHENSQFSSIAKIINESNELLQYFCYDCALQLFLDDNIDENLVQILSIAICKLTESDFNNNITPFTIRETVLKNRSQIESFMITLMNFTNNQFFDSKLLVDTLQNGNLNTMETIRNNLYITVIDSLWGSINENLDKNYLTNALNSIAPIKMSNDEIVLKYRTKWEFLVLLHYALSVEENLQFDQYIKDINKNLDIITNNSKEKLDLFDKFISSIKNNNVSLVLTIYDWFKDGDEIDLFLMDKICNTELPLQTKKYLLQKVDLTIVEQYLNTHIRLQNVNYFEDDDTLFFDWKFNQLKNLTVNGIANVINDINRNTTLTSEKITLAVCDYLLVLNASNQFVNKSKEVNEEIQGNLMDRLLNLLSKDCYKYAFLSPLLKEKTTDEAISYILENRKDLEKYGNSFEKIISSITPIQFSALDLPFTYQKKHPGFEIYQYINQSFEKLDSNQMPLNEFITSIRHKCSTNNNIKWFARMSLIIIGFNKYLVNRRNCPHYNQLFNNTQSLNTLLELTDSEKPILSLLFLSQSSHRNFNINIEEALFNTRNGPSFQQFKLIINVIAFMFGIPNNNNFYKYLFDASSIPGSCDITFPSSISNNMDCNSQYQWTSPSNEPPRWVPSSKPVTLTEDTYKLLQFILFSSLALQTYIFDNAFAVYKDRMSSGVPRQGEEGEENLNENQKVRNFVWRKQDIPFMGIAFDKSKDEKFKIICNYLDLLQKFFTNHTNHILCNRVYTRVEDTREAEKRLQIIYTEAVALSTNETAIEDTETADLLVNMQTINQPVQIENEITLSIIKSKFEEELNDNKYKITSLYLTNRNLFNYSILIPYCVEFYYWILNTFNGLLLKENLEQPISKLIEIYTSKNLRHGKHIQNVFTEIANLWNRYIDENGSFGFACNRGAINIKISNDSPILLFVESSEEEPSILLAVINFLVKLHNDSVGSLEEEEEQLKRVPLHLIKIEHTMFLFTITEEKFKEIILSNMIGEMKFNWDSIEKSIKLEINALKSHKPKIDIPSKIVFKFRNDKEIVEFGVYETQIEKRVNEIVQYGEYNELIDDQHLLRKQLLSLSYTSLIDHFDTLIKIVEHCRSEKEEEEEFSFSISSSPSTISSILSDLEDSYNKKSLDNQHLDNNSKILIEPILVLEVDKIGTILLLLLDVLKSRDHLYCDIVELRKPLAETQKDILKERIDNISKEDFTLFINGICSIPNFAQEYATKRAKDNISLLEYIEEIDPLEDDDPIRSLLLEDLLLEQYVDYHKFLCSIHRQSQVVSTAITDWRDDLDSVIEITQEEEEQQSKKTKLWFEFEKKEENSVTFSEEDLCKLQEGIKQNEDEIIELKEQLINSVHSHSVREEIIELEELNDYIRPNQNKEIETASILNLNVNDVKQKTADGTCTTIIANPVNPITSDVELETVIVATSSEGNNNNEYCDGFTADELIEWLKEKTQFNSSQLEIISKFIIDKGYDGFSFLSITKDKLKETTLKNGPIDKLLRLVNEWKDNQSTVISHARNTFNSNFSTDQLVNWIKTGGIKGLSNSQIDTLTNYLSEEEYDAEGFLGLDLEESNLKGLFLFKVGQVIKDLNKY